MKIIDMHCDTICELTDTKESLLSNSFQVDVNKLQTSNYQLQNFALFTDQGKYSCAEHRTLQMYVTYKEMLEQCKESIAPVYSYEDILKNEREGKISSLLTLEEGDVVFEDIHMLRFYYDLGVRMIALTWNYNNAIGFANTDQRNKGLMPFGFEYIQTMEELGMIIDVSHLNDAGFYDVYHHTTKPFVASHSNARTLCDVPRNLLDDMILKIAERRGVIGINFYGQFLKKGSKYSTIEDIVNHIVYMKELAGIDVIGLGTDFDGIDSICEIEHAGQMGKLQEALVKHGFTQEEIEKIFYKNVLRVYKEVL